MMARRYTAQEIVNELLDVVDEDDSEDDFEGYVTEEESGSSDSEVDDSENSDSEGDYSEGGRDGSGAGEDGREWSGAGEDGREWSGAGEGGIGGGRDAEGGRDGSDAGEGGIGGGRDGSDAGEGGIGGGRDGSDAGEGGIGGGRDGNDAGEGGIGGGSGTGGGSGAGEGGSGAGEGGSGAGEGGSGAGEGGSGAGEGGSGAGEGGSGAGEGRRGSIPVFRGQPGCVVDMANKEPIDFFSLMVPESLLQTICEQTILYSQQYVTSNDISRRSRVQQWLRHEHDVKELKKFLACIIVMGVINYPAMEDWWCTSWPYATRSISSIMSRDRFSLFLRFLHLNDNTQYIPKGQPGHDPLFKVRPFLDPLLSNFKSNYSAHREISIDEQMIGFKGRLHFIQYLPKKPTRWGMKAFVLADSHDGYVLKWKLYTGK